MASKVVQTVYMTPEDKQDLETVAQLLGWSLTDYCAAAIKAQVEHDKAEFPKAYAAAVAAQEEVRAKRSA